MINLQNNDEIKKGIVNKYHAFFKSIKLFSETLLNVHP